MAQREEFLRRFDGASGRAVVKADDFLAFYCEKLRSRQLAMGDIEAQWGYVNGRIVTLAAERPGSGYKERDLLGTTRTNSRNYSQFELLP